MTEYKRIFRNFHFEISISIICKQRFILKTVYLPIDTLVVIQKILMKRTFICIFLFHIQLLVFNDRVVRGRLSTLRLLNRRGRSDCYILKSEAGIPRVIRNEGRICACLPLYVCLHGQITAVARTRIVEVLRGYGDDGGICDWPAYHDQTTPLKPICAATDGDDQKGPDKPKPC